ncbi:hypothetical protein LOTGIDRAFT_156711 [Lottia gigantea]|uniref:G-protein coupled receptors family 2 profile 2 domain-containing protein n=1 Tax=Lottia gigantea TaxID=225164 RepID=V4CKI8_LOTGI|nr:hypothetical protein LOTGIDRAFT_156711 [Lottia gigantea]ESP02765.1 hypothetical protein LOTGIDRAFT_156711 [Lottia gigantea]
MRCRDDESDMRRRFLQYSIYIYGMPAVLVTITLVTYIVSTDGSDIGYGGAICFLASDIAIALAFGIPVAITIVSNSLFFIITVRSIRNCPKIEKSKQDEQHATVYIKLSTLTGITWTLGFLAIITGNQVLSYLFILINASQGIFLFISFVCNERIKKLISQNGRESGTGTTKTNVNTAVNSVSADMD